MLDFHGDRFVRQQVQREMEGDGEAMDRVRDELLERANHPDVWGGDGVAGTSGGRTEHIDVWTIGWLCAR